MSHPSGDFMIYGHFIETLDLGLAASFPSNGKQDVFVGRYAL